MAAAVMTAPAAGNAAVKVSAHNPAEPALEGVVKIEVQPAEFFESAPGKLSCIATVGTFTVAACEKDGRHSVVVYDQSGKIASKDRLMPGSSVEGAHIARLLESQNRQQLHLEPRNNNVDSGCLALDNRMSALLGVPGSEVEALNKAIESTFQGKTHQAYHSYYSHIQLKLLKKEVLAAQPGNVYQKDYQLFSDPEDKALLFQSGNSLVIVEVVGKDGKAVEPCNWQLEEISTDSITNQMLKSRPYLAEFQGSGESRVVDGTPYSVRHERSVLKVNRTDSGELAYSVPASHFVVAQSGAKEIAAVSPDSTELLVIPLDQVNGVSTPVDRKPLPFSGQVKRIRMDHNSNF